MFGSLAGGMMAAAAEYQAEMDINRRINALPEPLRSSARERRDEIRRIRAAQAARELEAMERKQSSGPSLLLAGLFGFLLGGGGDWCPQPPNANARPPALNSRDGARASGPSNSNP